MTDGYGRLEDQSLAQEPRIITNRAVPHLLECCFCFSLRIGVLILGWLTIIGAAFQAGNEVYYLRAALATSDKDHHNEVDVLWIAFALTFISMMLSLLLGTCLLVGTYKKRPNYLMFYIVYCIVYIILNLFVLIMELITGAGNIYSYLAVVVSLCFTMYFAIVVNSYKQELLNERENSYNTYVSESTPPNVVA